jgi:hypothetical protein
VDVRDHREASARRALWTLTDALRRGRFTEAQMNLAKKLVAEVGA